MYAFKLITSMIRLWKNMSYEERKCQICDDVEDEFHCLVKCPRYECVRKGCLPAKLLEKPSMFEFVRFMQSEEYDDCVNAGILCMRVMREHEKYV